MEQPKNDSADASARPRRKERGKFVSSVSWGILTRVLGTERPSQIAAIIGHGITAQTVRDWRRRYCGIPAWVRDLIYQQLLEHAHEVQNMPTAVGRAAPVLPWRKKKKPR